MESFKTHLIELKLSPRTINTHIQKYNMLTESGIDFNNQKQIISFIDTQDTDSKKKTMASTASKYLTFLNKPNNEILTYIQQLNKALAETHLNRSKAQVEGSITFKQLTTFMNGLYETEKWREFVIIYCFVKFCCRNQDLVAEVVKPNADREDNKNYFVVSAKQDVVMWYRNVYKTKFKYDTKITKITNKKFLHAISQLEYVLKENDNFDRVVKKITTPIGSITQSVICKIVLNANPSMNNVQKVSESRGTAITTLHSNYNGTSE